MKSLPSDLSNAGFQVERFVRKAPHEWHGPCPRCGGRDRCSLFTDRPWPSWNWWCRICSPENHWIDELNPNLKEPPSPERLAQWKAEAEASIQEEIEKRQAVLQELRSGRIWEVYHRNLTEGVRALLESWGIPADMQNYWMWGYNPDKAVAVGETFHHTPTVTIPIFEPVSLEVLTIRHRLLAPPEPGDKYRPERKHLPNAPFVANLDQAPGTGPTAIFEGEKKAAVWWINFSDPAYQALGLPGKNFDREIVKGYREADPLYVFHDPDAPEFVLAVSEALKREVRAVSLPMKIDDAINKYNLGRKWLASLLRQARKVSYEHHQD